MLATLINCTTLIHVSYSVLYCMIYTCGVRKHRALCTLVLSLFHAGDRPLVVQFAARNAKEFADASELVAPFADAVDLNCGCPQS